MGACFLFFVFVGVGWGGILGGGGIWVGGIKVWGKWDGAFGVEHLGEKVG